MASKTSKTAAVRLPNDIHERITDLAARIGSTVNDVIKEELRNSSVLNAETLLAGRHRKPFTDLELWSAIPPLFEGEFDALCEMQRATRDRTQESQEHIEVMKNLDVGDVFDGTQPIPECDIDRLTCVMSVKEPCEAPDTITFAVPRASTLQGLTPAEVLVKGHDKVKYVCMNSLPQEVQRVVFAVLRMINRESPVSPWAKKKHDVFDEHVQMKRAVEKLYEAVNKL